MRLKALSPVDIALTPARKHARSERGYAGLAMALIGLMAVSTFVIPAIVRSSHSALVQRANVLKSEHIRSATEHVLWRIKHDDGFAGEFSGNPWSASYSIDTASFDADVAVETTNYSDPDEVISLALTADPKVIPTNTSTEVTFSLELFNVNHMDEQISAIEVFPQGSISASFDAGSASGITGSDPANISGGWRWNFWPYVDIDSFGGEATQTWRLNLSAGQGQYWFDVIVYTASGSVIHVPLEASVKSSSINYLRVDTTVSKGLVEADQATQYDYQLILRNNSGNDRIVSCIRHYAPSSLTFVPGSTTGVVTSDPSITTGQGPNGDMTRYTWSVGSIDLDSGVAQSLRFSLQGALPVGEHFTESTFRITADGSSSGAYSVSTGQGNQISATRRYLINIQQGTQVANIEAWILENEAVVLSTEVQIP